MRLIVIFWAFFAVYPSYCQVLFEEMFPRNGPLENNGWTVLRKFPKDNFYVDSGVLTMECERTPIPAMASCYQKELPNQESGELYLEIRPNIRQIETENRLYIQIVLGNIMLSFRKETCQRYYIPKDHWQTVASNRFKFAQWTPLKIVYDNHEKIVKYYAGDMETPAYVEYDIVLAPQGEKLFLQIGNYGRNITVNQIRNICFSRPSKTIYQNSVRDKLLVFKGISSDLYDLDVFINDYPKQKIHVSYLDANLNTGHANNLKLDSYPQEKLFCEAKTILLVDIPFGKTQFPEYIQNEIAHAVKNGAKLIVLGGLFSLNKGEPEGTVLGELMPINFSNPWAIHQFSTPIDGIYFEQIHQLIPKEGASVLWRVKNHPVIIKMPCGKGDVTVSGAIPCGIAPKGSTPFYCAKQYLEKCK